MSSLLYRASAANRGVDGSRLVYSLKTSTEREISRWRLPEREAEGESGLAAGVQAPLPIQDSTSHFNTSQSVK